MMDDMMQRADRKNDRWAKNEYFYCKDKEQEIPSLFS